MAIEVKKENTFWDRLRRKNFVPFDYYKSNKDIVNYNTHYLSIYFSLKNSTRPCMHWISSWGEYKFHPHLLETRFEQFLPEFDAHERRPWFIIDGQSDLLAKLKLSGEELHALRGKEVAFYFYEPLFQVSTMTGRWPAPYDRQTEVLFPELIWLDQFLENHGHAFKAAAYVCDYRLQDEYLKPRGMHKNIKVKTWDIFVQDKVTRMHWEDLYRGKENAPENAAFTKKFICPNFRYDAFREVMAAYLLASTYGQEGYISFFFNSKDEVFFSGVPFDVTKIEAWPKIQTGRVILKANLPMALDTKENRALDTSGSNLPDFEKSINLRGKTELEFFYRDSFLSVVNESRFGTLCGEISEKVLLPIRYHRPFVMIGGPYMLRYLREQGFETFGDFWDESYDEIEDHEERMQAIFNTLDSILSRPVSELQDLYLKMKSILEKNRRHLLFTFRDRMYEDLHRFQRNQE